MNLGMTKTIMETTSTITTGEHTFQGVVQTVTAVSDSSDLRSTDTRVIRTGDITVTHSSVLPQSLEKLAQRL
jgi:hypothetical protein